MAVLDLAALATPIADGAPCGADLDLEEDDEFLNFVSACEMSLPDRYFVEDHEGNRKPFYTDDRFRDLDLAGSVTKAAKLLTRTRDIRLLSLVAKLAIFDRKLDEFVVAVEAIAALVERSWDEVHPSPATGLRTGALERLNEQFTIVTALNNAPLIRSRRFGTVSRQSYLAAVRDQGGQGDSNTGSLDRILGEECRSDPAPIAAAQTQLGGLAQALGRIRTVYAEKMPSEPLDLGRLVESVGTIRAMLERINPTVAGNGIAIAEGDTAAAAPLETSPPTEAFPSTRSASQALAVAVAYLASTEPSSPALLLLRHAQALVGKSFLEALESLLPDHVRRARLSVATLPVFDLPLVQIAEVAATADRNSHAEDEPEDSEADDPPPRIGSRAEALSLLDRVAAHYRVTEPSSPIPLLIERARGLLGKDFVTLITSMLPHDILHGE